MKKPSIYQAASDWGEKESVSITANELTGRNEISGWISVKDRLPELEKWVWIFHKHGFQTTGRFLRQDEFGQIWKTKGEEFPSYGNVSHWMPLPEKPKE